MIQIESSERISEFFTRVLNLVNQMKNYGEEVLDQAVNEKISKDNDTNFIQATRLFSRIPEKTKKKNPKNKKTLWSCNIKLINHG